jgi:hypothetical protein
MLMRLFNIYHTLDVLPIIHGGEPTIYPNISSLLRFLKVPFIIFTNLTKPISFFEQLHLTTKLFALNVSLHPRYIKNVSEFIKKVNEINEIVSINLNVLLEHDDLDYYTQVKETCTSNKLYFIPIRYNSAVLSNYNRDNYYDYEINKFKDFPFYTFTQKDDSNSVIRTELECVPDIGGLGRVKCDIKRWQRLIYANGDLYYCNRNKKIVDNIYNMTDEQIINSLLETNDVCCNNVPCSLCLVRYGTKETISEDEASQYEQYSL